MNTDYYPLQNGTFNACAIAEVGSDCLNNESSFYGRITSTPLQQPSQGWYFPKYFGNLTGPEIFKTILLAVIGTIVSYITSALLKKITKRLGK